MTGPDDPHRGSGPEGQASAPGQVESFELLVARERTNMAWTRTAIAFAATGAAILRNHLIAGLVVLGLGLVTWAMRLAFPPVIDDQSRPRRLLLVTITVTTVGIVALVVVFSTHSAGFR
jgi:uncharacterized membrane protein YidH (DUF202 family)